MLSLQDRLKLAKRNVVAPLPSLVAPIRGWNTRDALDVMDPADAVLLDNWYPDAGGVNVRNGYVSFATGVGTGNVKTLAEYNAGTTRKLIAAASGKFYDISSGGAAGAALASGFSNDGWQSAAFLSKLFFFNGVDTAQVYNGTVFADAGFTGVTLSSLIGGIIYQQRLFAWQVSSTGFWYAPLNSITGLLKFFDLAGYAPHGGNVTAAVTFSHDGGNGVLDIVAFIMSSGDCLMYYGNDPGDVSNFQLVGIYRISPPVAARAVCNYGADAFLTTYDDHVPMQQQLSALRAGQLPERSKVSNAVQAAVVANLSAFGWQALYYPAGRRLIFNIPNPDGTFSQHVQNTGATYIDRATGKQASPWCRFQNMNAFCFGLYKDKLYFGGAGGIVYQADTGALDVLGTIAATAQQAWTTFDDPSRKRIAAARPIVRSIGATSYTFSLGFDYGALDTVNQASTPGGGSPWDISPWDTSPWSPEQQISTAWHSGGAGGTAVGVGLAIASAEGATWLRTDFKAERGQFL